MMKMFMIVSAGDSLKRWFPIDRIIGISEEAEGTRAAHKDKKAGSCVVRSSISVLNEECYCSTYYSEEEAESIIARLELCCKLD